MCTTFKYVQVWKYQNRQVMLLYKGAGLMEAATWSKQLKPDGMFHFLLVASTEGGEGGGGGHAQSLGGGGCHYLSG